MTSIEEKKEIIEEDLKIFETLCISSPQMELRVNATQLRTAHNNNAQCTRVLYIMLLNAKIRQGVTCTLQS